MNSKIRIAQVSDARQFVEIKNQLSFQHVDGTSTQGGFLLGTDLETYDYYIQNCYCLVAEKKGKIVGFGIILNDVMLRNSALWKKKQLAQWSIDLQPFENSKICYFEQLAFLPGNRMLVLQLAYNLVKWAFDQHYQALFTTTVKKPITNLAALPFIRAVGGKHAGNIDEVYPVIGQISSDIYLIEAYTFFSHVTQHRLYPYLRRHTMVFE